jgi:hypothetical protein
MDAETVQAAIAQCERAGLAITVANVAKNVLLKPGDYSKLIERGLKAEVGPALKRTGFITKDEVDHTKVEMVVASLSDLRVLLRIKGRNITRSTKQYNALKALVGFLEEKERELGYEPYVYQFEEDARRIYAMHGVELPASWGRGIQ